MNRKMSDEHKRKISNALKGKTPKNLESLHALAKGKTRPELSGENNPRWKGDDAVYGSKHTWVRRHFGAPSKCDVCGTEDARKYEWHNLSGKYTRNRQDWKRLCISCHRKTTFASNEYEPWNKGRKVRTNTGRTHIQPGQHLSESTEFQQGLSPWNKHLEPKTCLECGKEFQPRESSRKYCSYQCYWSSLRKRRNNP